MSFTNTPVTRTLVLGLVSSSIAASLFDLKHYFYIVIDPHILRYHQLWRLLTYQLCYTNSAEVLFASIMLYNMRIVERMWGSRKYASFIAVSTLFTAVVPPFIMAAIVRPLSWGIVQYLPAGPTALIFAILAQYHAIIPRIYKYQVALSASPPASNQEFSGLTLSDKSYRYILALQLALFQWQGSLLSATVGWVMGYLWRNDLLPPVLTRWRVPTWLVGGHAQTHREQGLEDLRRRLDDESSGSTAATATGVAGAPETAGRASGGRRRPIGQQILDQFRGAH